MLNVTQQRQLAGEQVRLLYERLWQPVVSSLLAACLLVTAMWPIVPQGYLLGWLLAIMAVSAGRLALARYYHRMPEARRYQRRWLLRFALGTGLSGLIWGVAGVLMFTSEHSGQLAVLVVVLAGVSAGGVTTLSAIGWVAPLFVLPTLLPLLGLLLLQESSLIQLLAALVALFLGLVLVTGRRLNQFVHDNISLRLAVSASESQLRISEARYRAIFRHTPLGVLHFDHGGRVVDCNEVGLSILGVYKQQLLGMDLFNELDDPHVIEAIRNALKSGTGYFEGTYRSVKSGKRTPLRAFFSALHNESGERDGGVVVLEDFTERKRAEETIHRQAYFDSLTELPNRRMLIETLASTIRDRRDDGCLGLLMFLDMDRFKIINDTLGHSVGDELLRQVSKRLLASIDQQGMAARLSGDEFVILLPVLSNNLEVGAQRAEQRAELLLGSLRQAYDLGGQRLSVTPSIGYTLFPLGDEDVGDVLRHADTAMYQAKLRGRAQICGYEPAMQAQLNRRLETEQALRRALVEGQMSIAFQPQYDAQNNLVGAEALMRWQHPQQGWISPEVFIPIAEESDLIVELETWLLEHCCALLARVPTATLPRLSINISVRHFTQPAFVEAVTWAVGSHNVDPSRLVVELTESVMINGLEEASQRMEALKRLGVRFALDDFGTGFSSLAYLKSLPLDELKIDRSFVKHIDTQGSDAAIVETILAMARHLGIAVVAEGVENEAQQAYLLARDCQLFQGFYYSRPLSGEAFEGLLAGSAQPSADP